MFSNLFFAIVPFLLWVPFFRVQVGLSLSTRAPARVGLVSRRLLGGNDKSMEDKGAFRPHHLICKFYNNLKH